MYHSNDDHYKVLHYFLADAEMTILRLVDYMETNEIQHYFGHNETILMNDLLKAFKHYNNQEKRSNEENIKIYS